LNVTAEDGFERKKTTSVGIVKGSLKLRKEKTRGKSFFGSKSGALETIGLLIPCLTPGQTTQAGKHFLLRCKILKYCKTLPRIACDREIEYPTWKYPMTWCFFSSSWSSRLCLLSHSLTGFFTCSFTNSRIESADRCPLYSFLATWPS
jgi:hypothetical protein